MRNFKDLIEARGDTAVFTLGRFNPPTTGHEKLIIKLDSVAKQNGSEMYVFPTHSNDPAKNPLPHGLKVAYMKKMYKKYAKNIKISKARNVFEVAKVLYDKGHKSIIMVVGSDRVTEFTKLLEKYNGTKSTHGFYEFDNIQVVSAGERDPDAEGVSGMSASKMRAAAADGDKDSFLQGVPSSFKDGDKLYSDVRKNMGIREERDMGDMSDFEAVRDAYLTGKIWNVGDVVESNGVSGEVVRKGTNYLSFVSEDGKVNKAWLHDITLDERNYAKEYANYHSRPEQIANRSSRNKARRVMGDKTKIGMDVGHKDNDPMNNSPENLRNEDPSVNRREPRLREKPEIEEDLSTYLPNVAKLLRKINIIAHPKGMEKLIKKFAKISMNDPKYKNKPNLAAVDVARETDAVTPREFIQYINKLVDKGVLPKELKAEVQYEHMGFREFAAAIQEVKQDSDVKDKKGTQPAKYYAGDMSKSTKDKRDAHFKAKKSGPAPGDSAETKPSKHTKKFKQMFGEVLPDSATQKDYIDDFEKSDAPQFQGKSKEKRREMAIAAYLSKNESLLNKVMGTLNEDGHTDVQSMKNKVKVAMSALQKMQGELDKLGDEESLPTWWTNKVATAVSRLDDMSDYLDTQVEDFQLNEKIAGLVKKADKSGMPYGILKKVYDRGMAAWKTGHRPGTTPQQWAFARVNSFTTKSSGTWGKADSDLAKQVRGESLEEDPCWDTHKQVGMKKKSGRMVPNCVPKNEEPRIPRKKGQPAGSDKHSDLYTDENPVGTIQGLGFKDVETAKSSVKKIIGSGKTHAHKIQAAIAMEQRAKEMGKSAEAAVYRKYIDKMKQKTKEMQEDIKINSWGEITEKDDKSGKELNNPTKGDVKKYKVYVRNDKGNVVKVEFGDPNMEIKRDDPARRKAFRARHNCDQKKDKTTAGYWSCKFWSGKSVTDLMKG